jgi:hypothetical protein
MASGLRSSILGAALAALSLACGRGDFTMKDLPSGHRFKILRAGQVKFEKTGETAAMLVFESDRAPGDRKGVEADVTELWDSFRTDAEKANLGLAVIQADLVPKGLISHEHVSMGFAWRRGADGRWAKEN